jgi:hypothetical protein
MINTGIEFQMKRETIVIKTSSVKMIVFVKIIAIKIVTAKEISIIEIEVTIRDSANEIEGDVPEAGVEIVIEGKCRESSSSSGSVYVAEN